MLTFGLIFVGWMICVAVFISYLCLERTCLLCWLLQLFAVLMGVGTGSSKYNMFLSVGSWDLGFGWIGSSRGIFLRRSKSGYFIRVCLLICMGMRANSEKRPQQKICYRTGDETRGLDLEKWRKRETAFLPVSPASVTCELPESACWSWGTGKNNEWV